MKNLINTIYHNNIVKKLNGNSLIVGISIILLNFTSKYVDMNLTKPQEMLIKDIVSREIIIFIMAFVATRDVILSFILTGLFILLANYFFNEKSKLCLIKNKLDRIALEIDLNDDGKLTDDEINKAVEVLRKAKKQKNLNNQLEFISHLKNNS
jgi:hypothetical protein